MAPCNKDFWINWVVCGVSWVLKWLVWLVWLAWLVVVEEFGLDVFHPSYAKRKVWAAVEAGQSLRKTGIESLGTFGLAYFHPKLYCDHRIVVVAVDMYSAVEIYPVQYEKHHALLWLSILTKVRWPAGRRGIVMWIHEQSNGSIKTFDVGLFEDNSNHFI